MNTQTKTHPNDETLTVWEGENKLTVSLNQFSIKDGDQTHTLFDEATEIKDIQTRLGKLETRAENVSKNMVAIAGKAGKAATFRALCTLVEERMHWGRAPKDTPEHIAKLYEGAPDLWKQYKSKILAGMEAGVLPGSKATVTRKLRKPDDKGRTEVQEQVTVDSVHMLDKVRRQKAAPKDEGEQKPQGAQAGVIVDSKGEQHHIAPHKLPDTELGIMLAEIATLYDKAPKAMQDKAKDRLRRLVKDLEAAQPEVKEEAKKAS